jgi:sugar phosphate isomerase/epimerase
MTGEDAPDGQRRTDGDGGLDLELDLGFTLGLGMDFESTVRWAADEGFDFVELLLDGPYARERIEDRIEEMRAVLETAGVDVVVHLPFAVDPGSPFAPVREGAVAELVAGMDLAAALGAEPVVFHPSSDAWELGWDEPETRAFVHESVDELVPAARERGLEPCLENVVSSYYVAERFPELLARYPAASMTFDTSHALLSGMDESAQAAFCREHADRIGHLHLVDTRGGSDEHLPVGMGRIDFETVLGGLAAAGWSGTATLEVGTEDRDTIALGGRHVRALLA